MTLQATRRTPADIALSNETELRTARGILADAAHHTDAEIAAAAHAILHLSRDQCDRRKAEEWLRLIHTDP